MIAAHTSGGYARPRTRAGANEQTYLRTTARRRWWTGLRRLRCRAEGGRRLRALLLRAANRGYRASLRPAWERFRLAALLPEQAQRARLRAVLRTARETAFGREHGLARVRSLADWQAAVPVRDYDGLAPWVERVAAGEPAVLTAEPPLAFERSSGSTRARKLIPYTAGFLRELSAATGPWLYDLLRRRRALARGSAYWSISPGPRPERTPGGAPIGFEDDTEYFPPWARAALRLLLPVPPEVARLGSLDDCRYATLRYLAADPRLALISVWSPSFLTLLLELGRAHAERLADDVASGALRLPSGAPHALPLVPPADPARAAAVRAAFGGERLALERLWPRLTLVSCWTDAYAARLLPDLLARLPASVEVQPKGLLATEGVVSFPLLDQEGAVLAVASHLLELQPADDPAAAPLLPHQVERGGRYLPILSTSGGLYRYRLGDEVEVVGWSWRTPRVRFVGRVDGVSDLAGEKLAPGRVAQALEEALAAERLTASFALLAPLEGSPPRYALFVEPAGAAAPDALARLAAALERRLLEDHPYALCRELGQLGPIAVRPVQGGAARYEAALVARGQRAGDIKPAALHRGTFWGEVFGAPC